MTRDPKAQSYAPIGEAATDAHGENLIPIGGSKQNGARQNVHGLSELEQLQARIAAVETGIEWGRTG